jgi:cellulose synthase/poly-beta-1,6-N-acetylglucosamine synthase-like glycosyltransferase
MSRAGLVSVVAIGRNEGARLERCLASVAAMARQGFETEVIYVDSGSVDDSVAIAEGLGAKTIGLQSSRPTAAMGRNAGWRMAEGEIVLFLDGDTVLDRDFVNESLEEFADPTVAIVWGHRREMHPEQSIYNRVLDLDWVYAPGWSEFCGGDALVRREVLEAAGGFDETLIAGEEPELCRRILGMGLRILHVDRAMTGHDLAITGFGQYWRRATRAGHAFAEVSERFAATTNPFWSAEARRNRNRALALMGIVAAALVAAITWVSVWPLVVLGAMLGMLFVRTAWKARWKSKDNVALLLYGVHSHLQQIPIFVGQMQFWMNRRRGTRAGLVEYKKL